MALVNNKGDLGAALRQLGSSLTLKSLATAMVAAGLGAELTRLAGLDKALPKNAVFADRVAADRVRTVFRIGTPRPETQQIDLDIIRVVVTPK